MTDKLRVCSFIDEEAFANDKNGPENEKSLLNNLKRRSDKK